MRKRSRSSKPRSITPAHRSRVSLSRRRVARSIERAPARLSKPQPRATAPPMTADVTIGTERLAAHPLRAAVLGEVHARPFTPIDTPRRVLHFAFDTTGERGEADRLALIAACATRGLPALPKGAKHHRIEFGATALRWEQHSEFTTYTWELPSETPEGIPFHPPAAALGSPMAQLPQPGPLLVAIDLHLIADTERKIAPERLFDRASLAAAENSDATALYATDFQSAPARLIRTLFVDPVL